MVFFLNMDGLKRIESIIRYWVAKFGWELNACLYSLGLARIPLIAPTYHKAKRFIVKLLAVGGGIPCCIGGERFYLHPLSIGFSASYEPYTTQLFLQALQPGFTVFDIGACHGYYSLIGARRVGKEGKVYAFEPAPENFEVLLRNIELNRFHNICPVNKAVSNKCTTASFFLDQDSMWCSSLYTPVMSTKGVITVECILIDEFFAGKSVNVIKMDIEGNEPYALEGMKETIFRSRRLVLFVEFNPFLLRNAGVKSEAFLAQLDQLGFEVQLINEKLGCLEPITEEVLQKVEKLPGWSANLYCVKG